MISPHKSPNKGTRARGSPRTAVPLWGLFQDGAWHFYTCQQDQRHRCNFFLWETDAEAREKLAGLSNSRSDSSFSSSATPRTPTKTANAGPKAQHGSGLPTPQTDRRNTVQREPQTKRLLTSAKARMMAEEFEWDDPVEIAVMEKLVDTPIRQPDFGVLWKTPHVETTIAHGKRKRSDFEDEDSQSATLTPASMATPQRDRVGSFLTPTPTRYRGVMVGPAESPLPSSSDLAIEVSRILDSHDVPVPSAAKEELKELFNRYHLKTQGITRGRDISRIALKKKDGQIAKLNERLAHLESLRELNLPVTESLKRR